MKSKLFNITNLILLVVIAIISYFIYTSSVDDEISTNSDKEHHSVTLTNKFTDNLNKISDLLLTINDNNYQDNIDELSKLIETQNSINSKLSKLDTLTKEELELLNSNTKTSRDTSNNKFKTAIDNIESNMKQNHIILDFFK